jgi:hypothetical protein
MEAENRDAYVSGQRWEVSEFGIRLFLDIIGFTAVQSRNQVLSIFSSPNEHRCHDTPIAEDSTQRVCGQQCTGEEAGCQAAMHGPVGHWKYTNIGTHDGYKHSTGTRERRRDYPLKTAGKKGVGHTDLPGGARSSSHDPAPAVCN